MSLNSSMEQWQSSELGREFTAHERLAALPCLEQASGRNAMQIGCWGGPGGLLEKCRLRNRWVVDVDIGGSKGFCSQPAEMAVSSESLDLIVLPHTLERVVNPHHVLREAKRTLAGEGILLLLGFNPWSTWGIPGLFGAGSYPWSERFISETRLRDWLSLLEFEITDARRFFYRPPVNNQKFLNRTEFIERVAARWLPLPPSAYLIMARKKIPGMTPIAIRFKQSEPLVNGIATPTARVLH